MTCDTRDYAFDYLSAQLRMEADRNFAQMARKTQHDYPRDPWLASAWEVDVLPALSTANVRELLRATMPLPQLSEDEAAQLVVTHLVNRTLSRKSRLKHRKGASPPN